MNFDRKYLDLPDFASRRTARDNYLRDHGVDPGEFHVYQRDSEVGNETDTDEYRETQPSKGLAMISDFLADFRAGVEASEEVIRLTQKWMGVVDDAHVHKEDYNEQIGWYAYGGAEELAPILRICFDFMWEEGGYSLYTHLDQLPTVEELDYFKEATGGHDR